VTRPEHIGLQFFGFLEIPRDGLYTFFIKSDDGSRLYVGTPSASVEILREVDLPSPSPIAIGQRLAHSDSNRWVQIEGKVTFARKEANGARLELGADSANLRVHIADDSARDVRELFNCRIRATGFCQPATTADGEPVPGLLLVPGWSQVELIRMPPRFPSLASASNALPVLTAAVEVHRLKREEAQRGYPVSIRGVVTSVLPEHQAFTFQDSTRGLYVIDFTSSLAAPPQPGDLLEVEGTTDPSLFAPVVNASHLTILGPGKLPPPLRPAWDQLMNGSMDAQLVELAGVVTTVEGDRMTLLTSDGIIQVVLRLSGESRIDELRQFEDAQVRLRGCLFASWDYVTHQVSMGELRLYGADIFVDQPAPVNVFSTPAKSAAELRLFDPQAGAYQRVKVSGQIVFCRKEEYFMMQGGTGLRFIAKKPSDLESGDTVEVVGFPDWTSVFPVLREAAARKTGHAALPPAARLTSQDLAQSARDATRVILSATLVGVRVTRAAQIFELQDGARAFTARLDAANETSVSMPPGSRLQLTGVYAAQGGNRTVGQDITSFELLVNSPADIQILARPPWWTLQRLLVALGVLAGVLALSFLWITQLHRKVDQRTFELATQIQERQRAEQQRSTEQERARVAQDLHDELGSGLTEVSMLVARARQDNASHDKRDSYLEQMGQRAKEMVIALDEIVWAMNPRHDSLGSLVSYLSIYAERFLSLANISWRLAAPPGPADVSVDSRCRHQLFLAFKEALTNVVRHSGATEVELKIEVEKGHVQLNISDNGRGLAGRSLTEEMDGVGNMRARLQRVGGMFQLASRPESGTTLSLSVPARCEGI
jgi:signal transduction histidine kinase